MNRKDTGRTSRRGRKSRWSRCPCEGLRGKGLIEKKRVFVVRFKHGGKNSAMIL